MNARRSAIDRTMFALGLFGLVFLILPVLMLFPLSLEPGSSLRFPPSGFSMRWYQAYLSNRAWLDSTIRSLEIAAYSSLIATILGCGAAIALSREHMRGLAVFSFVLISPMLIPHIVLAIAMYSVFASLGLAGSKLGLVLAHAVLGLPFVILNVASALRNIPADTENGAMSLGGSPVQVLWDITLPLVWRGLFAGAIFAFVVSFDEVVVAMFLSSATSSTLPKRMLDGIFFDLSPMLAAVSVCLVVFNVALASIAIVLTRATPSTRSH